MYPEFENDEIKDIHNDQVTEPKTEPTVAEGDVMLPIDNSFSDIVGEVFDTVRGKSEIQETPEISEFSELPEKVQKELLHEAPVDVTSEVTEPAVEVSPSELENSDELPSQPSNNGNYLLYGGTDIPEGINYKDTLKFLTEQLKYDGGELRQARRNKDGSGIVNPEEKTMEVCSYCHLPISGVDYYRLPDGRKRCTNCNRSLVKSLEELNSIFNNILLNMELFFGAVIDVPISVEMIEERKLKKKIGKGLGNPPSNVLILGVAVEKKGKYKIYVENGIPRASLIATLAHELTHIWQYIHWNSKNIKKRYGSKMRLVVYEGMAMWTEIQYLYHIGEETIAKREKLLTLAREDEYGTGFKIYIDKYPLATKTMAFFDTPFMAGDAPLN